MNDSTGTCCGINKGIVLVSVDNLDTYSPKDKLVQRFLSKVDKHENGCWLWTASKRAHGYGQFSLNCKPMKAHRVSWLLFKGPIKNKLWVLHKCDVPSCVNPEHLFLGNALDNTRDMFKKSRNRTRPMPGELHWNAKLTWGKVKEIRAFYIEKKKIRNYGAIAETAREFGITVYTAFDIAKNRSWIQE